MTATKDADRIAALDVLRIINKPTATSLAWDLLSEVRIRSEIRSGSAPKIGYPGCPDPNPDSKILDPSKPDPDPDILIFRSGYPDPDPYF
ncbi:hypothetical protein YC2023_051897 [Brassica napus]